MGCIQHTLVVDCCVRSVHALIVRNQVHRVIRAHCVVQTLNGGQRHIKQRVIRYLVIVVVRRHRLIDFLRLWRK